MIFNFEVVNPPPQHERERVQVAGCKNSMLNSVTFCVVSFMWYNHTLGKFTRIFHKKGNTYDSCGSNNENVFL